MHDRLLPIQVPNDCLTLSSILIGPSPHASKFGIKINQRNRQKNQRLLQAQIILHKACGILRITTSICVGRRSGRSGCDCNREQFLELS